ncbi:MAG: DUF1778 domain-containing protein [Pyrinomonadaceae bacterium]
MASTTIKNENIHFRIAPEIKKLIEKAMLVSGRSLTEFATASLVESANAVLEREYTTVLSNRDRDLLLQLLDADDEPSEGLREAAELHRKYMVRR